MPVTHKVHGAAIVVVCLGGEALVRFHRGECKTHENRHVLMRVQ
jgi:hypothetical protein